ncbi:BppU family phage baseplate upper protein [Enterococcus faecalis]|uniref:BppU family phage baseplate upper protein n=1 Tax=Enterococcus faecalis TaxID=1351 RepID=UPI0001F0D02F|nr:BppU family phage baseplate upper protein [Enterococcus faecalis]EFT93917.1 hypothetical protein HMPREF9499_02111 [Enterococcus faecalis TX0012]
MANKILNLDFSKDPIMPPIIYGRVGDEKMQTITVKISERDEIPDLSDGVITFEGEPAGGKVKVFDSENVSTTSSGLKTGTFEYTFPSAAFSVEGTYKRAYFSFQKDGKRDTTGDFKIIVKGNADIDAEEAETIITEYNKLVIALNEAYQAALNKMNTDYNEVVKRIDSIKDEMNKLQTKIDKTVSAAEGRISKVATDSEAKINTIAKTAETNIAAIGKSVTEEMNKALQELHAADFYTRSEAEAKFAEKGEAYTKQESDGKYVDLFSRQEIGGTKEFSKTPLVNGKEVALKDETFIYKKAGLDEVEAAYRSAFGAETNILLVRKGNKVDAYLRVNVVDVEKIKANMVQIFKIPKGFMVDQEMRAGYWNTALTTVQYTYPQGNYGALYEEGVKGIRFCSDRKGNHYVFGSWYTADAFPET